MTWLNLVLHLKNFEYVKMSSSFSQKRWLVVRITQRHDKAQTRSFSSDQNASRQKVEISRH